MISKMEVTDSRVRYEICGPLGIGQCEGPIDQFEAVRARARYAAGYRNEP